MKVARVRQASRQQAVPLLGLELVYGNRTNMVTAYVALGANLGDTAAALKQAVTAINNLPQTRVNKTSGIYLTAPQGDDTGIALGGDYLNAVAEVQTDLTAYELLEHLQSIEQVAGRQRLYLNAPRTLDLDLLLYGSASIDSAHLTVPHPRMLQRAFVLAPLQEIAPALVSADQLFAVNSQAIHRLGEF